MQTPSYEDMARQMSECWQQHTRQFWQDEHMLSALTQMMHSLQGEPHAHASTNSAANHARASEDAAHAHAKLVQQLDVLTQRVARLESRIAELERQPQPAG